MTPSIDIAGWMLVHFVWQGALVAALAAAALGLMRARSPQARYVVACAALGAMLAAPLITAGVLASNVVALPPNAAEWTAGARARSQSAAATAAVPPAAVAPPSVASPARRAAPGASVEDWLPLVVALWAAGVVVLLARLGGGWMRIRRLQRLSLHEAPSRWESACARIATRLGVERLVRVVDSARVDAPAVIGWLRPVILLPIGAIANLSPAQVDAILAHELAHVRRHDFLINGVQALAETLLFYHPAVWWISARIRTEREHCCDLVAVDVCGDAVSYAEALTELETWRSAGLPLAVAATGGSLLERVRRVLGVPAEAGARPLAPVALSAALALLLVAAGATQYLRAAQPEAANAPTGGASSHGPVEAVAWRMVFHHPTSELSIIGYTGRDLIRFAYQVPRARIIGGPRWLDDETFSIVVNLDHPPAADEMFALVRQVLENRFALRTHRERRDFPVFALVMARPDRVPGPNLKVSTIDCFDMDAWIAAGQPPRDLRRNGSRQPVCGEQSLDSSISRTSYVAITMRELATSMRGMSPERLAAADGDWPDSREVVDRTGLEGRYDVDLHALLPAAALMGRFPVFKLLFEPLGVPSMERALEEQLGLALEPSTAPYDVIVIDSAQRPSP